MLARIKRVLTALILMGVTMTGVAFLPNELTGALQVTEFAWGADLTADPTTWTWTDVSSDVLQNSGTVVQIGRQQENQSAPPATITFTLDNKNNDYTQYNPLATNWPNVREGTPVRRRLIISSTSYTRFEGRAVGFKPITDESGKIMTVIVTAAGITQPMGRKEAPSKSVLYRTTTADPNIAAYWSFEDAQGSTQAASAIPGVSPMGMSGPAATFASVPGPGGSDNIANISSGTTFFAEVNPTTTSYEFYFAFKSTVLTGSQQVAVLQWTTRGTRSKWEMNADRFSAYVQWIDTNGNGGATTIFMSTNIADGNLHRVHIISNPSGPYVQVYIDGHLNDIPATMSGETFGGVTSVTVGPQSISSFTNTFPVGFGQLSLWNAAPSFDMDNAAWIGYAGETPEERLSRICTEEGLPFNILGFYVTEVTMGPQGKDSWMNIARECELTEPGWLYDGLGPGIHFMGPSQRYDQFSQFTIDGTAQEVIPPFQPLPDDFGRVNKSKVDRKNGSSAVYEDTDGPLGTKAIGTYEASPPGQPNYETDDYLDSRARFEVFRGTRQGYRYPTLKLNVRTLPTRAAAIAGMKPGYMFTLTPPYPTLYGTYNLKLIAEGWIETSSRHRWDLTFNCSLQEVYQVWKVGDTDVGRLGADGHSLASVASSGSSTLSLTTPTGKPLWTTTATNPGDFPMYLAIDGIRVKVTAISGTSSPQTATVDATTVTKSLASGKLVTIWKNGVVKL